MAHRGDPDGHSRPADRALRRGAWGAGPQRGPVRTRPAQQRWHYDESADLADLAASYLVGFTRAQGFRDGNKRTGLACALVFLAINGAQLHPSGAELLELTMKVATNRADDAEVATFLRRKLAR